MPEEFDFTGGDRPPKIPTPAEQEATERLTKRMVTAERCGMIFLAGCVVSMFALVYVMGKQEGMEERNKQKGQGKWIR